MKRLWKRSPEERGDNLTKEKKREWRRQMAAEGRCIRCGKIKDDPNYAYCTECRIKDNADRKKRRERQLATGICTRCGKVKAAEGKQKCEACLAWEREAQRLRREWLKANHICPKCGTNTLYGREKRCYECSEKDREYRYRKRKVGYRAEYSRERRERQKALGICVHCGKRPAKDGRTMCAKCLKSRAIRERERRGHFIDRSEYPNYGICYQCCKRPVVEGKRLCKECIERSVQSLRRSSSNNEYWRRDNNLIFIRP